MESFFGGGGVKRRPTRFAFIEPFYLPPWWSSGYPFLFNPNIPRQKLFDHT